MHQVDSKIKALQTLFNLNPDEPEITIEDCIEIAERLEAHKVKTANETEIIYANANKAVQRRMKSKLSNS